MKEEFKRLPPIKNKISAAIKFGKITKNSPLELFFQDEIYNPKFKITIELIQENSFVDSEGNKWVRVTEDEEQEFQA